MSSILRISGSSQGVYQFIQSLSGTSATQATSATTQSQASTAGTGAGAAKSRRNHLDSGAGQVLQQIQNAVTSALQAARASGSSVDSNSIVEDAIGKILKNSGNSTSSSGAPNAGTNNGTSGDADGDSDNGAAESASADTSTSNSTSGLNSFFQTLQSYGISPKQFMQDFQSAIQSAQGGQVNASKAFASIPIGTVLDTAA